MQMPKTVTLRLSDESYAQLSAAAHADNRSIANMIETLAIKRLQEERFTSDSETDEILRNESLMKKLARAHRQVAARKGRLVG